MINYGKVRSAVKPAPIEIDEYSVWVNTDIFAVEDGDFSGYEYNMQRYDKNEYILQQNSDIDDIMSAICELAEIVAGGE